MRSSPSATSLTSIWLTDDSLEDIGSLPEPDTLAAEIVENLEATLEQFRLSVWNWWVVWGWFWGFIVGLYIKNNALSLS